MEWREELIDKIEKLKKQNQRELDDNNGLRKVIMMYSKMVEQIEQYHKQCSTCDNCDLDNLKDITDKLHKEIREL